MISPDKFRSNELTLDDNVFQVKKNNKINLQKMHLKEFDRIENLK